MPMPKARAVMIPKDELMRRLVLQPVRRNIPGQLPDKQGHCKQLWRGPLLT